MEAKNCNYDKPPPNKMYIVDDDPVSQFVTEKLLEYVRNDMCLKIFPDGQEAISYLRQHALEKEALPEIILLDLNMPFLDGWAFLDEYKAIKDSFGKKVLIYILSSSNDSRDMERAANYDFVAGYIVKPPNAELFQQIIDQYPNANRMFLIN